MKTPSGRLIPPPENGWRWSEDSIKQKVASGEIVFRDGDTRLVRKIYLADQEGRTPETVWAGDAVGTTRQANAEIKEIFGATIFDTPKPTRLIRRVLELLSSPDALVLDFFAGSASTADAVMRQNAEDGGRRRFIMVQIPEPCEPGTEAAKAGYTTISQIGRERVRRVGARLGVLEGTDVGFRSLHVATTNMADRLAIADDLEQLALSEAVSSVKPGRTDEDLLFQVLLDWGLDLSEPIAVEEVGGRRVLSVAEDALMACFADEVTESVVQEIARRRPLRAVFLDAGFASDAARINAEQIFREVSPETEVKAI